MNVFEPFEDLPEPVEFVLPEGAVVADPVDQRCESLRPGLVVGLATFAAVANQASPLQSGQVPGNHRLRYAGVLSESVNGELAVADEPLVDGSAGGIGECPEEIVCGVSHRENHNPEVMDCQAVKFAWAGVLRERNVVRETEWKRAGQVCCAARVRLLGCNRR